MLNMMLSSQATTAILTLLGLVVGFALGYRQRPEYSPQNSGEELLTRTIRRLFKAPDYYLLNHITLKHRGSTTQIDHILVSRFGVFVIETKNYSGWIFGDAKHDSWTQVTFHDKYSFQNPIRQNFGHVQAVQALLDFLPASAVQSAVVFVGDAKFKTDVPNGVFTLEMLIKHLKSCTEEVISPNRVQFCVGRLETARLAISGQTDLEHVQTLRRKFGHKD
jgi:hypothetical protein